MTKREEARLRRPVRNQAQMMVRDLDSLVAEDHPVRAIWEFGVGSARYLDELCWEHDVYRWLCGGVTVNPDMSGLADFRVPTRKHWTNCSRTLWRR